MNITPDKYQHFFFCLLFSAVTSSMLFGCGLNLPLSILSGMLLSIMLGFGKEIYDYFDYGLFDWEDIYADLFGAIAGAMLEILLYILLKVVL